MRIVILLIGAVFLDFLIGDPAAIPHPVCGIGKMISCFEKGLRKLFPNHLRLAGKLLAISVPLVTFVITFFFLWLCNQIHPLVGLVAEIVLGSLTLAAKSLKKESMKVYEQLYKKDLPKARYAVSMIVGRDTQSLDEVGVTKAAVETVAENTSDGIIAPMFYMAIGGVPLAMCYKAINTLDSMVGYKNEKYLDFGRASAKLDDIVNFIPARLAGIWMVMAAFLTGLDGKNSWKIFRRDSRNHASPNSAQTESACAGALQVQLAGNAYYFGKLYEKPTIGDSIRPIEISDIVKANRLMYVCDVLCLVFCSLARTLVYIVLFS